MKGGQEFRNELGALGLTQRQFALLLGQLGDPRPFYTAERWVHRLANGKTAAVPGEAVALLRLLGRVQQSPASWSTLMGELGRASPPAPPERRHG
ncbi:MAG TPA: hypothetical protein VGC15_20410 [Acetobacteraceae bacterium]